MTNLTMNKQEVIDFLEKHNFQVFLSYNETYDKDGNFVEAIYDEEGEFVKSGEGVVETIEYWGFSSPGGFHTFDMPMDEDKAKYATALFYKLHYEYKIDFGSAERLAGAYVATYKVMQEPLSKEEQEEVRQKMLKCLEEGNVEFAGPMPDDFKDE